MINELRWQTLCKHLDRCCEDNVFPGANLVLINENDIKFKSAGYKQKEPLAELNDLNTLYDLASVSKVLVTATCILKLIEEGLLSLNYLVSDILPDVVEKDLTIRHCLTHTSGLPSDIANYKQMSKEELLCTCFNTTSILPKNSQVIYSDINFIYLGLIIEKLKGSLQSYAQDVVFTPCEMIHTGYNPDTSLITQCASTEYVEARGGVVRGKVHDGKAHIFNGISGHAGVFSTIQDISNFLSMMLNNGKYKGKEILSPYSIGLLQTCLTPNLNEHRSIGWVLSDRSYGLGDYFSSHTIFHTGFSGTSILIDFDKKIAASVLSNRVHPSRTNRKFYTRLNSIHNLSYLCCE